VKGEAERHFIDIDIYGDSAVYKMPRYWKEAVAKYTEDTLRAYGINPWHVHKMHGQLVNAFKNMNAKEILRLSADLGHYIADGNVPLHTTHNYNGQYTNQYGIHAFWESRLPELYFNDYDFFVGKAEYIKNTQIRAWQAITEAHLALDSVLRFEKILTEKMGTDQKYSYEERNGVTTKVYSVPFSKAYHDMLNGQVERRMRASIKMVGDFWYTCWVDAGQPDLDKILDFKFDESDIEELRRENELWKQKLIEARPEASNFNNDEHFDHHHVPCCGYHDFYSIRLQVAQQFKNKK
jgi:hypothetical protein